MKRHKNPFGIATFSFYSTAAISFMTLLTALISINGREADIACKRAAKPLNSTLTRDC